ncbi:MAG TPA: response regulator transcription factor [Micropruina sp.]|nr:response regulator transcription factor [Micropruina sp.]
MDELEAAVEAVQLLRPDVVLASTALACPSGKPVVTHLRGALPDVAVIGVLHGSEGELLAWAAAGARGFVPADVDATGLGRAVVAAARGEALLAGDLLEQLGGLPKLDEASRLTQREAEVRDLINEGLADKQIALRLGISAKTVEKHVGAVLRKAGVRSRTELLARV